MGCHHQGNQHFGLGEGRNHDLFEAKSRSHCSRGCNGAPAAGPCLSQLDTAWSGSGLATVCISPLPPPVSAAASAAPQQLLITAQQVSRRDLVALQPWYALEPQQLLERSGQLELLFDWPRQDDDPRELSEIPELRLWSLRADALCPWLPLLLERSGGQLTRHVAMLLPHRFSRGEGIRFAPDSLELWMTHRLYLLDHWSRSHNLSCRGNLEQLAAVLGFELDASFWDGLD
ncbi:MAG: DUF1817 domain-containing protein [Synechococcaceae bacterium WB8_1B_136]|nr:DUF1817 domain-containing protein [Synechococcaceae bacterium WB8_1B_136]